MGIFVHILSSSVLFVSTKNSNQKNSKATQKPKKITLNSLNQLETKMFTKRKITVSVEGQNFEVIIDERFKPALVSQLIQELFEKLEYAEQNDIELKKLGVGYAYILIIKYFTDINIGDDIPKQLAIMSKMENLGIFEPIMNAFKQEEIDKILEYMKKYYDNAIELINNLPELEEKFGIDLGSMVENVSDLEQQVNDMEDKVVDIEKAKKKAGDKDVDRKPIKEDS